jgi:hypothetical protein
VRRGTRILVIAAAGLGLAGAVAWVARPKPVPPSEWAAEYDLTAKSPERIASGTVVGTSAPDGWSHLVIKSLPRVRADQVPVVRKIALDPDRTLKLATWMFTAFAADVRPDDQGRHRLRAVGLGLGTNAHGRDIVITPETAADSGVSLDWLTTKQILTKGYEVQDQARMVVHGPTFGLMDTPVVVHQNGASRSVRYRYALLVDAQSGRLDVLLVVPDDDPGTAVRIAPNTIDVAELVPDPKQFNAVGIPNELGFGVEGLPPYTAKYGIPPALRPLVAQRRFTPDEAHAIETGLRSVLIP